MDALALALIAPKGLSVTAAQAQRIVEAYGALLEYDKRPVQFQQRIHQKPLRGRFARSRQYSTGHVKMKRYNIIQWCMNVYRVHSVTMHI